MALATNLHRRGAVYYWRRRVPATFALATGANWLKLSLRTREPVRARFLAAQLDATAADLFMTTLPDAITKERLATLFRKAFLGHELPYEDLIADLGTEAREVESERPVAEPIIAGADPITVPSVPLPIASSAPPLAPTSTVCSPGV